MDDPPTTCRCGAPGPFVVVTPDGADALCALHMQALVGEVEARVAAGHRRATLFLDGAPAPAGPVHA